MRVPQEVSKWHRDLFGEPFMSWRSRVRSWEEGKLIVAAVSQANLAGFCVSRHRRRSVDRMSEEEVAQALDGPERESLSPVTRALLGFAEELTLALETMSSEAVGQAIDAGASVSHLRDVVEIVAVTNVVNRMTMTLGRRPGDVRPRGPG
ncbi:MAG TPA: hypothetical protein VGF70_01605 [Solirubrobacteraceae bacterium]|jgi:alkylhydroperoxidase family enzyme